MKRIRGSTRRRREPRTILTDPHLSDGCFVVLGVRQFVAEFNRGPTGISVLKP
jgi:hypothetical protein